jgi:hypothetical protein
MPQPAREFFAVMDAANVDLKAFTDDFYFKLCGGHLQPVLDILAYIHHETKCWLEITTLLIPGKNDSPSEIKALADWVARELGPEVPVHFTAFHPDWKMDDLPPTPPSTLTQARRIALDAGLHYVYTGNVHDTEGGTTFCPGCQAALIERDWYNIRHYDLPSDGRCPHCGTRLPATLPASASLSGRAASRSAAASLTEAIAFPGGSTAISISRRARLAARLADGRLSAGENLGAGCPDPRGPGSPRRATTPLAVILQHAGIGTLTLDLLTDAEERFADRHRNVSLLARRLLDGL